ncbi:MAG: ATP-binding protein [Rhodospirillales bacterium]|jgi:PAS domain S-box-containing protein
MQGENLILPDQTDPDLLPKSAAELRDVLDGMPDVYYRADLKGNVVLVSRSVESVFGYSVEEMLKLRTGAFYADPEDGKRFQAAMAANNGVVRDFETKLRHKDGRAIWVSGSVRLILNAHGQPVGIEGILRDITSRKEDEKRILHYIEQIEASNEELEQFAYVASHDLREPLRTISTYVTLLERRYTNVLDQEGREFIALVRDGAKRLDRLILDLLDYASITHRETPLAATSSAKAVDAAISDLEMLIRESGATIAIAAPLPMAMADPLQLERLFRNLIHNAIKYRSPDRPCRIELRATDAGKHWRFAVLDNGIGIESQYFERIFGIFKRLHKTGAYEGTGIGLAACKRIVERSHGDIWVESVPGQGSTFFFTLRKAETA